MKAEKFEELLNFLLVLALIFLLLVLSYVVVIAYLDQKSINFQIGALSTWISGCCSFLTLGTAWYAINSWRKIKYRDEAYNWTKKMIIQDYPDMVKSFMKIEIKIKSLMFYVNLYNSPIFIGPLPKLPNMNALKKIDKSLKKFEKKVLDLEFDSITLKKLGFDFENAIKKSHKDIILAFKKHTGDIRLLMYDEYMNFFDDIQDANGNAPHSYDKFMKKHVAIKLETKVTMKNVDMLLQNKIGFFDLFTKI